MTATLRPGILFDVDGTLIDTNYLHTLAWSRAFRDAGEWAPMNAIHRLVGMGGDQLVPTILGHDNAEVTEARTKRYGELIDEALPFPGATALVRTAHEQGIKAVLATSAPADELDTIVDVLQVRPYLDGVTTADDIDDSKPAPDVFLVAMESASLDPARTLAVGDSVWDVEAASAAGIGCVAVESGGFSRHELSEAGALQVYADAAELLAQFLTSPLHLLAT